MDKELIVSAKMYPSDCHHGYTIRRTDGFVIADVMPIDEDGIEGRAYANCFAAAPGHDKLLEQLRVEMNVVACSGEGRGVDWFERRIRRIDKQLAKARGES